MSLDGCDQNRRWELRPADENRVRQLQSELGLPHLVARTLVARGIDTPDRARTFFKPSLDRDWAEPAVIPGLTEVADAVEGALDAGLKIAIFGDFDVDGVTATAVLARALRSLGAEVVPFLPRREGEGYGLSIAALERLLVESPEFLVTVDNGIAAKAEVAWLLERGVKVAVTDHHEAADLVPEGIPVCDPKLADEGPSRELAGVGVALKLVCELGRRRGQPDLWRSLTDLASLGTVADLMPFTPENRALVADGVAHINAAPRPGIAALAALAGADTREMTSESLSFSLIPRINAAGRIDDPKIALDLLLTDDLDTVNRAATQLEEINTRRRQIESELAEQATAQAERVYHGERALVLAGEGWHEGVKGIVASRLVNTYKVPTILFSIHDGIARGSGRTVGSINLFQAVSACSDILERFGGHEAAVGVTVKEENLPEFVRRFTAEMDKLPERAFVNVRKVDAMVDLAELTYDNLDKIQLLQPFGQGMREPLFVAPHVFMDNRGVVGKTGDHLRFTATDGLSRVPAIRFRCPQIDEFLECDSAVDVVFEGRAEEWHGRCQAKMIVRDIEQIPGEAEDPQVDDGTVSGRLMAHADEYLAAGPYVGIEEAVSFHTKVAGVTFEGRQELVAGLAAGDELALVRDSDNAYDPNAVAVLSPAGQVGFLNRQLAERLAPCMDGGAAYAARVTEVTGGMLLKDADEQPDELARPAAMGLNIEVRRAGATAAQEGEQAQEDASTLRARWAALPEDELDERLKEALIGSATMHQAQVDALANLKAGRSTLVVMATGRGKSLIFHLHAARTALRQGRASVFVYPLRALVADQLVHLSDVLARFGLTARVLTGETPQLEREEVLGGLASGDVHVILTTPEYLALHAEQLGRAGRIGFLAVDEAHHIGLAKSGHRSAYHQLPQVREQLGRPVCLAATATCRTEDARAIEEALGISARVIDPTIRENLAIDDQRSGRPDKARDTYLASIAAAGEKLVAYTSSRNGTVRLARMLRKRLPQLASRIAYYHGGLPRAERLAVEEAFRTGEVVCLIATSAFGEGVNIPDIRHVVLYHLPFNDVEFNQMSGRAGRDGQPATVHLLYSRQDQRINEQILGSEAPSRTDLAVLYRAVHRLAQQGALDSVDSAEPPAEADAVRVERPAVTRAQLVEECLRDDVRCGLDEDGVTTGLAVFSELGFVRLSGKGSGRRISYVEHPLHADLATSTRYREGLSELEGFSSFASWALEAPADEVLARINRPILPE